MNRRKVVPFPVQERVESPAVRRDEPAVIVLLPVIPVLRMPEDKAGGDAK